MTIHRFFIPSSHIDKGNVAIRGDEGYHLIRILRAKKGMEIRVFTEKGSEFHCRCVDVRKSEVIAEILEKIETPVEPTVDIQLALSLIKSNKMDIAFQKSTEIGASGFHPIISKFSVPRPTQLEKQLTRWDRIVLESAKQSERRKLPPVYSIKELKDFIKEEREGYNTIFLDSREGKKLKQVLTDISAQEKPHKFIVLIGPEGGFAPEERELLLENDWIPINLGPRILRSETAGPTITSLILYELE